MRRVLLLVLALVLSLLGMATATAQAAGPTVAEVEAIYGNWTAATAVANGYLAAPFCVDGRVAGVPALGTMGFHYAKPALFDATLSALQPEMMLVFDGKVVGVEYGVVDVGQPTPSVFGQAFAGPMPGHEPGMPTHYDLHVWFINNPGGQFAEFNPALSLCPAGTLPPAPPAAGDSSLPYAVGGLALVGIASLGVGLRLVRGWR